MSLSFIDFEVFAHDWLVVIMRPDTQEEVVIINDKNKLDEYYQAHKDDIYVGYNIRNYDQFIFKAILCGLNPKDVNDYIICEGGNGYSYSTLFRNINLNIFDAQTNRAYGLKQLEGFMGDDIEETSVPFDIDRKLTAKELSDVVHYCKHDVAETMMVFMHRYEEFTSQLEMVKTFNLPLSDMSKSKAQLSAKILDANRKSYDDEFNFVIPKNKITKYKKVVEWYQDDNNKDYEKNLEIDIARVPHIFAWGGLHGARPNYRSKGYFINVDVASYYPSMMIECGYSSRNIADAEKFKEIYHTRLKYKAEKNPKQAPLKIVLNSTYGAMKDKYNPLYDPLMANNVCVTGQLWLLDLIEHLEPYCDIIQSNTDGILVKLRANNDKEADEQYQIVDDICFEWEQRTGMNLEFDEFVEVIQKDVNNYIIIDKDGKYKSKGAYVKKLDVLDYDLPIVNKALVNYFVNGVSIDETINNCDSLIEFQKIVKVSGNYDYAMHGDQVLENKCFRVFASNTFGNKGIYKVKEGKNPEKFANTPENCFIDNSNIKNKKCPRTLDKQWYIDMANTRLFQFLGE